jgi:hypothetical protein
MGWVYNEKHSKTEKEQGSGIEEKNVLIKIVQKHWLNQERKKVNKEVFMYLKRGKK